MQAYRDQALNMRMRSIRLDSLIKPIKVLGVMKLLGALISKRFLIEPDRYLANTRDVHCDHMNTSCIGV